MLELKVSVAGLGYALIPSLLDTTRPGQLVTLFKAPHISAAFLYHYALESAD